MRSLDNRGKDVTNKRSPKTYAAAQNWKGKTQSLAQEPPAQLGQLQCLANLQLQMKCSDRTTECKDGPMLQTKPRLAVQSKIGFDQCSLLVPQLPHIGTTRRSICSLHRGEHCALTYVRIDSRRQLAAKCLAKEAHQIAGWNQAHE